MTGAQSMLRASFLADTDERRGIHNSGPSGSGSLLKSLCARQGGSHRMPGRQAQWLQNQSRVCAAYSTTSSMYASASRSTGH